MVEQAASPQLTLLTIETPSLVLDADRMDRNISRLKSHLAMLGVGLRPHLKTGKSVEVARCIMPSNAGPATVSTLKEAEQFAAAGVRDIIYAVGIAPNPAHFQSWDLDEATPWQYRFAAAVSAVLPLGVGHVS